MTTPADPSTTAPVLAYTPEEKEARRVAAQRAARRTAVVCCGVVAVMTGLSFAAVPLYDLFCRVTGFGGTPRVGTGPADTVSDRGMSVRFDANTSQGVSWQFKPEVRTVDVKLGETKTVFYKIANTSTRPTTGIASFNVQPDLAGAYFVKIQCFCFTEQTLQPGEVIEAPVVFYVDPALAKDRNLRDLSTITLSYTMFPSKDGAPLANAEGDKGKGNDKSQL
ncbi:MAG: cytochrome c oxidase assembly protein [Chelatococcus sp.]|jgi:cytochrome c oxidase assembly protein subunit 11|uniref:cytochrome c oxidase assembly protein n=1 Tax=unclassified Chelatococcus TaxID=2638111 RepID=UPI001BCD1820|nr:MULTISPECIES: cytochrome c oxidase assembly protein [unclassified Chelatococcus]CAH1648848.1 Cytochrome c oxidase assembly protein CtaG [Hyphomicrobiales bacterium]MBS7739516.1 cytochrome c oxidase assembly protein [Chelatococcus sp. HY11]MBX3537155.1 cytochrome c oxidase assembly protein [Chelatococcus sp.]MBX3543885.1 cytochrome c oxidase assembly protein [Chelatococcus sp.]MCO5075947.1 cytochrome c oxidase assembly protein [Chelatococcus sp.]